MLSAKNIGDPAAIAKRIRKTLEFAVAKKTFGAAMLFQEIAHQRTPVWSGTAAANHQWTFDKPYSGMVPLEHQGTPGTNNMPLGQEPNRSKARAISDSSLHGLNFFQNPYRVVFITNNTVYPDGTNFSDLEWGLLPGGTAQVSRVPAGGIYKGAAQIVGDRAK